MSDSALYSCMPPPAPACEGTPLSMKIANSPCKSNSVYISLPLSTYSDINIFVFVCELLVGGSTAMLSLFFHKECASSVTTCMWCYIADHTSHSTCQSQLCERVTADDSFIKCCHMGKKSMSLAAAPELFCMYSRYSARTGCIHRKSSTRCDRTPRLHIIMLVQSHCRRD